MFNRSTVLAVSLVSLSLAGHCEAADPVGEVVKVNVNEAGQSNIWARVGDLLIFSVKGGTYPGGMIENLEIAVAGESLENVGVWIVPVINRNGQRAVGGIDMPAFLKAARSGSSVIAITPVGAEGAPLAEALAKTKKFSVMVQAP